MTHNKNWLLLLFTLIFGIFIGFIFNTDKSYIQTSVVGAILEHTDSSERLDETRLKQYEVTPQAIADFVNENHAGYIDENGIVHYNK